jgi:hypothetical protein
MSGWSWVQSLVWLSFLFNSDNLQHTITLHVNLFYFYSHLFGMHADHTIFNDLQSEKCIKAIVQFLDKIEQLQNINGWTPYIKNSPTSGITILESDIVQTMVSCAFQKKLQSHHVIITDVHLFRIACDWLSQITKSSWLKRDCRYRRYNPDIYLFQHLLNKVPDQSTTDNPMVEKRTIREFIENLNSQSRNILCTFHIKSYSGMESLPFHQIMQHGEKHYQNHIAIKMMSQNSHHWDGLKHQWETQSNFGNLHLLVLEFFLIFNLVSNGSSLQHPIREHECDADYFTQWDWYLQDFDPMNPTFAVDTTLEAIRLEPGNRL